MQIIFSSFPDCWSPLKYTFLNPAINLEQKSTPEEVTLFFEGHQDELFQHTLPLKGTTRWRKITYYSKPKDACAANDKWELNKGVICVDSKSEFLLNIYPKVSKISLYGKFFRLALARPLHSVAKTIYHLTLGWFFAIARSYKEKNSPPLSQLLAMNLMDIIRTPIYGAVLTAVALTAIVVVPFNTPSVYDFRALTLKFCHELHWGRNPTTLDNLNPCMQKKANILNLIKLDVFGWHTSVWPYIEEVHL